MPIYEWECEDCKVYWEDMYDSYDDAPRKRKCPKCKKPRERLVSSFGAKFKGSGFYCNDYGVNNYRHSSQLDSIKEFERGAKEASAKRMDSGWQNYSRYTPNIEQMKKDGRIKRRKTDKEIQETLKTAKKLTDSAYTKADIDPIENIKKKPQ
jgi:putative FmdB family regulatory protein